MPAKPKSVIAKRPPEEMYRRDLRIDCQCARCGSSMTAEDCWNCEDGYSHHDCGEDCCCCLDPEPNVRCDVCDGECHWFVCLSSEEWCQANPLPGREEIHRGQIEWFCVKIVLPKKSKR